jgi:molybdopterin/thiamine biosynthesis adenylyltransferase
MPLQPWWKEIPGRLEWEFDWLTYEGFKFEETGRDDASGTLEMRVEYPADGRVLNLHVIFPPFFPDARYEVRCADVKLIHHQNPFTNELCLLGRSSALWDPDVPLAIFLKEQMPDLLKAGMTDDPSEADAIEDHQAEPATPFLPFLQDSVLLVDETAELGSRLAGEFSAIVTVTGLGAHPAIKGIIRSFDGRQLWTPASNVIQGEYGWREEVRGRWYDASAFPPGLNAADFLTSVQKEHPDVARTRFEFQYKNHLYELLAFRIPSEVGHRQVGKEWLMVLRVTPRFGAKNIRRSGSGYVRLEPFGRNLLYSRAPELSALAKKCVAVIGLGCIGAPAAVEFARAGVGELRILDMDTVDPGTIVRWPVGVPAIGFTKVNALQKYISENFPLTKVVIEGGRVGGVVANGGINIEAVSRFLKNVDLVLDATAELGVSSILSHLASDLKVPVVSIASTNGGWGGTVVTYEPGKSGCYDCFLRYLAEGLITPPPASQLERVQPAGCAEPTYLASNFDTGEIFLAGVRTSVSVLCSEVEGGYPAVPRGFAVLSLRGANGQAIYPTWQTYDLAVHPECRYH